MRKKKDAKGDQAESADRVDENLIPTRNQSEEAPLLMSLREVASYLQVSLAALRKMVAVEDSDVSNCLRNCLVTLSPRRRYIQRGPFLEWLRAKCSTTNAQSRTTNIKLDK
jgi:hypothetical protein